MDPAFEFSISSMTCDLSVHYVEVHNNFGVMETPEQRDSNRAGKGCGAHELGRRVDFLLNDGQWFLENCWGEKDFFLPNVSLEDSKQKHHNTYFPLFLEDCLFVQIV